MDSGPYPDAAVAVRVGAEPMDEVDMGPGWDGIHWRQQGPRDLDQTEQAGGPVGKRQDGGGFVREMWWRRDAPRGRTRKAQMEMEMEEGGRGTTTGGLPEVNEGTVVCLNTIPRIHKDEDDDDITHSLGTRCTGKRIIILVAHDPYMFALRIDAIVGQLTR
ncbi:hypothetical protein O9K51_06162 [Purpureocillium lavendulum]|uniref:Uncharacterized protein n=1 Tax=Purpureocillium lavendulum TaxID=1247861 RepID=A0AB34FPR1_9HYPO|nr:hypothetical protein O9K51_06162 [Purpureocillium lavendulum]